MSQARALVVSSFGPGLGSGRALRNWTVVSALARLGPVDVAYVPFGAEEPSPEYLALDGLDFHVIRPSRGTRRLVAAAAARLEGVPIDMARIVSPELAGEASRLADQPGRGRVVAMEIGAMLAMRRLARRRPVTWLSHNVESSFRRPERLLDGPALRHTERRLLRLASESWMTSDRDVALATALAPGARLRYVPNVVDVAGIVPVEDAADATPTVMMVADYTYGPNQDGARWLVEEVLPVLRTQRPGARVRLVGRGASSVVGERDGVETPGFVEDLGAAYATAGAVAVPLRRGGGTPLKFIEGLAYGVPVVATPVAAQGLRVRADEHYRLAGDDDPAAFAAQLADLLERGDAGMATRARALAEQEYSVQALVRLLSA